MRMKRGDGSCCRSSGQLKLVSIAIVLGLSSSQSVSGGPGSTTMVVEGDTNENLVEASVGCLML